MTKPYIDVHGVQRVSRIDDLPDESIHCYATAHQWDDPPATEEQGWGEDVNAVRMDFHCPCGRYKHQVLDLDTGDELTCQYGGGVMLFPGSHFPKRLWRVEWLRRKRLNAAGVKTVGARRRKVSRTGDTA